MDDDDEEEEEEDEFHSIQSSEPIVCLNQICSHFEEVPSHFCFITSLATFLWTFRHFTPNCQLSLVVRIYTDSIFLGWKCHFAQWFCFFFLRIFPKKTTTTETHRWNSQVAPPSVQSPNELPERLPSRGRRSSGFDKSLAVRMESQW